MTNTEGRIITEPEDAVDSCVGSPTTLFFSNFFFFFLFSFQRLGLQNRGQKKSKPTPWISRILIFDPWTLVIFGSRTNQKSQILTISAAFSLVFELETTLSLGFGLDRSTQLLMRRL